MKAVQKKLIEKELAKLERLNPDEPIHVVLSGGGIKSVGHIAFLEYLEIRGFQIASVSGSSAGSMVAAMYASGMSVDEVLNFYKTTPLFKYSWLTPIKAGIFDTEKYASIVEQYVKPRFEDLNIPIYVATTNLQEGKVKYFSSGELVRPLLASCAVPAVFCPVQIGEHLHADGGIMDNFPVHPFLEKDKPIVGSYVCPPPKMKQKHLNSIFKVTHHSNALLLYAANQHKFRYTDGTFIFPLSKYGMFDTKKIDEMYNKVKECLEFYSYAKAV